MDEQIMQLRLRHDVAKVTRDWAEYWNIMPCIGWIKLDDLQEKIVALITIRDLQHEKERPRL